MPYEIKALACDPKKLKGLSEKLIVSHWENNYGGAVKRVNAIAAHLASPDFAATPVFVINGLEREELIATNSMVLHELYFDGLGSSGEPDRVLPTYSHRDRKLANQWTADHTHGLAGGRPIVALDMYEQSYHMDYGATAAKYVDAFIDNIR